jgi:hypothetical protein
MRFVAIAAVGSALAIAPAFAQWDGPYTAHYERHDARVMDVQPVYINAVHEECWNPRTQAYEGRQEAFQRFQRAVDALDLSDCRTAYGEPMGIRGYDVRYRYGGVEYVARMTYDPGSTLRPGRDINWDGTPFG